MQFIDLKTQHHRIATLIDQGIRDVLHSQAFIQGPQVAALERALGDFCGAKRTVTCGNGTDALQLALMAYGIGPGDAVFVPSFTYTATAEVILLLGARPVFIESDPVTFNLCLEDARRAVEALRAQGVYRPAAIITVDLFGQPVDYTKVRAMADEFGLVFISDAAQGFGASYEGHRIGSGLADVTTTSFFPAKPLGCYGDGGAIFTDQDDIADVIRSICLHGKGEEKYDVVRLGVNSRLDTLQAAILLAKLSIFEDELQARDRVARAYSERLADFVETPLLPSSGELHAWAQYTVKLDNRDRVQAELRSSGIPTNVYYPRPMHLQSAYAKYGDGSGSLPNAERLSERVLSLPMHPYLSDGEIEMVCESLIRSVRV